MAIVKVKVLVKVNSLPLLFVRIAKTNHQNEPHQDKTDEET